MDLSDTTKSVSHVCMDTPRPRSGVKVDLGRQREEDGPCDERRFRGVASFRVFFYPKPYFLRTEMRIGSLSRYLAFVDSLEKDRELWSTS